MLLAQRLVLFGEELLTFQISRAHLRKSNVNRAELLLTWSPLAFTKLLQSEFVFRTYRAHKTGVMPGEPQSLQELVPCLDREVTAVAVGPKQSVVVCVVGASATR